MPMSQRRIERLRRKERVKRVNARSLNGKGYFMDTQAEADAQKYIETGDVAYLYRLPDYSPAKRS